MPLQDACIQYVVHEPAPASSASPTSPPRSVRGDSVAGDVDVEGDGDFDNVSVGWRRHSDSGANLPGADGGDDARRDSEWPGDDPRGGGASSLKSVSTIGSPGRRAMQPSVSGATLHSQVASMPRAKCVATLFRVFAAFGGGNRTDTVCLRCRTLSLGLDSRRLIAFGVSRGLLRRVHEYPVVVRGGGSESQYPRIRHVTDPVMMTSFESSVAVSGVLPDAVALSQPPTLPAAGSAAGSAAPDDGLPAPYPGAMQRMRAMYGSMGAESRGSPARGASPAAGESLVIAVGTPFGTAPAPGGHLSSPIEAPTDAGGVGAGMSGGAPHLHQSHAEGLASIHLGARLAPYCDGRHNLDEICCTLMRSHSEVRQILEAMRDIVILRR